MKKYFEPEVNIVDYEALENLASLIIGGDDDGALTSWNDPTEDQTEFGF